MGVSFWVSWTTTARALTSSWVSFTFEVLGGAYYKTLALNTPAYPFYPPHGPNIILMSGLDNPLAQGFKLRDGKVTITVPDVPPRESYIIVCKCSPSMLRSE